MKKTLLVLLVLAPVYSSFGFWPFSRWSKKKEVVVKDEVVNLSDAKTTEMK